MKGKWVSYRESWDLEDFEFESGIASGVTYDPEQVLLPNGGSEGNFGLIVRSPSRDFAPTQLVVNGELCIEDKPPEAEWCRWRAVVGTYVWEDDGLSTVDVNIYVSNIGDADIDTGYNVSIVGPSAWGPSRESWNLRGATWEGLTLMGTSYLEESALPAFAVTEANFGLIIASASQRFMPEDVYIGGLLCIQD